MRVQVWLAVVACRASSVQIKFVVLDGLEQTS